ncbi:hypothetical protein [Flavobacterium sp.]|uniref:hypothetical protein n=1 Tax=Flavobacterium sp. TaxID=239 RepID=UPI0037BE8000
MLEEPYWKRLIDEATRARPDLAYKFKSASEAAKPADSPSVVMSGSPDSSPVDIAYTDKTEIPGRPTFPFEVRVMADEDGIPTTIRCYKGKIYDPRTGQMSSSFKGLLVQGVTSRKRVTLSGNRGNVSGDQRDFGPSNYDPGPEQFKYSEYNDPIQTTWLPNYEGLPSSGISNVGKDSDPIETTVTFATGSYPIGKDSFTAADDGAYFDWPYVDGAMVRIFCYDDGDPATRKWGIWGSSGLPDSVGSQGFFIFLAQINGTQVMQMFRSDIVALGGGGVTKRAFLVHPVAGGVTIEDGTANGKLATGVSISNFSGTTYFVLTTNWSGNNLTSASVSATGSPTSSQTDSQLIMPIGEVSGTPDNYSYSSYLSGSIWVERYKCGQNAAEYFVSST